MVMRNFSKVVMTIFELKLEPEKFGVVNWLLQAGPPRSVVLIQLAAGNKMKVPLILFANFECISETL
jgi:hypothetical protein